MSNPACCYVDAHFADEETAAAAHALMLMEEDTTDGHGRDLGMGTNWLFDDEVVLQGDIITFQGNVRWGLDDPQAVGLIKWFLARGAEFVEVEVEEGGNNIYCRFIYKDEVLMHFSVAPESKAWADYHGGESIEVVDTILNNPEHKDRRVRQIEIKGVAA